MEINALVYLFRRWIIVYLEYQSVCPIVEVGSPTPSPASECVSSLGPKGGEQHYLAGPGVGGPNSDDWIETCTVLKVKSSEFYFPLVNTNPHRAYYWTQEILTL
jgi:hypothetical protein